MLDKKEACKILGIAEDATKDEMIKRYDIQLKKHKVIHQTEGEEEYSMEQVNEAYNLLMGYESKQPEAPVKSNPVLNPIYKKLNLDEKKVNNFFHYHKTHIIVGIIALIVLITTVRGCVNRVNPDLFFTVIGDIYVTDVEKVQNGIKGILPESKAPQVDPIYLSEKTQGEQAYAMQMKAMTLMAAGDMDLLILDRVNFERFGKQGAFISLEDLAKELGIDREKNKSYVITPEEGGKEALYGINVTESAFLKQQDIKGKEMIAAIRVNAKHHDAAVNLFKLLEQK